MIIEVTNNEQIEIVEELARKIWNEHYPPIIGQEQVGYMIAKFQSREAIAEQIREGIHYYLIDRQGREVGYLAVKKEKDAVFLSKIYVQATDRGSGLGKEALRFVESLCQEWQVPKIYLTVNKNNTDSINAYLKLGFVNTGSVVMDIGGGFVMDDYKLERVIS